MWNNFVECKGHRRQYDACALHSGYLSLQIHTRTRRLCNTACSLQQCLHGRAQYHAIRTVRVVLLRVTTVPAA